jgi:hypothetical protein
MKIICETLDDELYFEIVLDDDEIEAICDGELIHDSKIANFGIVNMSIRQTNQREKNAVSQREKPKRYKAKY